MAQSISIFECKKEGAREEWYSDFAKRAQTEYVGHPVDWLRTLSTRISVQYMVFEMEDPWVTADKMEKDRVAAEQLEEERPEAVVPPSIFDVPWAIGR
ncbi:uncharacterized protein N7518_007808 [Penicillium psychrosexuale]|uniref:uncharacterized protein n=1 Tax=Penicillium psychrosexuale TaxID=1002107 RepID=UPI002545BAD6|nr:uncharacterized protein N7518_007808 [Penicillium psychrosexuale]KAJ5790797.1 hypothetical protein N7518_007808 [Penicillium psychrosexuale]